jgi:hypothetical protein
LTSPIVKAGSRVKRAVRIASFRGSSSVCRCVVAGRAHAAEPHIDTQLGCAVIVAVVVVL